MTEANVLHFCHQSIHRSIDRRRRVARCLSSFYFANYYKRFLFLPPYTFAHHHVWIKGIFPGWSSQAHHSRKLLVDYWKWQQRWVHSPQRPTVFVRRPKRQCRRKRGHPTQQTTTSATWFVYTGVSVLIYIKQTSSSSHWHVGTGWRRVRMCGPWKRAHFADENTNAICKNKHCQPSTVDKNHQRKTDLCVCVWRNPCICSTMRTRTGRTVEIPKHGFYTIIRLSSWYSQSLETMKWVRLVAGGSDCGWNAPAWKVHSPRAFFLPCTTSTFSGRWQHLGNSLNSTAMHWIFCRSFAWLTSFLASPRSHTHSLSLLWSLNSFFTNVESPRFLANSETK